MDLATFGDPSYHYFFNIYNICIDNICIDNICIDNICTYTIGNNTICIDNIYNYTIGNKRRKSRTPLRFLFLSPYISYVFPHKNNICIDNIRRNGV